MLAVRETTHVLSAFLEVDGSITMIVLFPDTDQAIMTTIDPIETTIQAASPAPRRIDLTYGAPADRHLRLIVAMHADALAYERELERSEHDRLGDAAPVLDDWAEAMTVACERDAVAVARAAQASDRPLAC